MMESQQTANPADPSGVVGGDRGGAASGPAPPAGTPSGVPTGGDLSAHPPQPRQSASPGHSQPGAARLEGAPGGDHPQQTSHHPEGRGDAEVVREEMISLVPTTTTPPVMAPPTGHMLADEPQSPRGSEDPLSPEQDEVVQEVLEIEEVGEEEGIDILQALSEEAGVGWLHTAAGLAEDLAPMVIAVGLAVLQPELAALVVEEIGTEAAAGVEEAVSWANLQLDRTWSPQSPELPTLEQYIEWLRKEVEKPGAIRTDLPKHSKLQTAAEKRRQRQRAESWVRQRSKDDWSEFKKGMARWRAAQAAKRAADDSVAGGSPSSLDIHSSTADTLARAGQPPTPEFSKPHSGVKIRTGAHSVVATGITASLLLDDESTDTGPANYIRSFGKGLRDEVTRFQGVVNVGYQVGSWFGEAAASGGTDIPVQLWGTVLPVHEAPIDLGDPVVRHDLHVHTGDALEVSRFTQTHIAALFQGGRPSERFVTSALNPELQVANLVALKALTTSIERDWEVYDTSMVYAKLVFYSFLYDHFGQLGVVPALPAFNNEAPTWINLDDGALDPSSIPNAIIRRDLTLVEGTDWFNNATDIQLVRWLHQSNRRLDGPANGQTPHSCYIQWPSIPITILGHGAVPAWPAAAQLTSTALLGFASRLAANRGEYRWFVKGIYAAMELLGTRLTAQGNAFWPLRSNLSCADPDMPRVADYNVLFRLLKSFPPDSTDAKEEAEALLALSPITRLRTAALYNASLGAATTTLLHDLSITTNRLINWTGAEADTPPLFVSLMSSALNRSDESSAMSEAVAMAQPRKLFKLWLGCGVHPAVWANQTWLGDFGQWAARSAGSYGGGIVGGIPTRRWSPLIIDNWLLVRPIEWGIVGPRPQVNLQHELRLVGAAATQGWYGNRGSTKYAERVTTHFPMKNVVYGAQVVNVICENLRLDGAHVPVVSYQPCLWTPQGEGIPEDQAQWGAPVAIPAADLIYQGALHVFDPCVLVTFDYVHQEVRAHCLVGDALAPGERQMLSCFTGQSINNVGYFLQKVGRIEGPLRPPRILNFGEVGMFRSRAKVPSAARGTEEANQEINAAGAGAVAEVAPAVNPQ